MLAEPKLLVVDDEEVICEGCRRVFTRQGFEVEKCSDACQGLALAKENDYSAILLDIKMPNMDGIAFLESLRKDKPEVPVVLMTGYPSVPNAASAVRLGASDYVTKPFTPEEISQAVHRLLCDGRSQTSTAPEKPVVPVERLRFWHKAWFELVEEGPARVGAVLAGPGAANVVSFRLPRIGEVVFQGLPMASVTISGQPEQIVPAPISGVVVAVNESLVKNPTALLSDPCGEGWIACISPTRLEEEANACHTRRVVVANPDGKSAAVQSAKLKWLGCDVRMVNSPGELAGLKDFDGYAVAVDAAAYGAEGPAAVGQINTLAPAAKAIVLAAADCTMESAYRIRRIFYYAVDALADNEMADILYAAFQSPPPAQNDRRKEAAQPLCSVLITNNNRSRVRLLASPGLLRREEGLGRMVRQKLMQQLFPLESSPDETAITPMNLLGMATKCDRLIVLLAQDADRLPGSLVRDAKAEFVSLSGKGADKVTTLVVQPQVGDAGPLAFDPLTLESLAEHLVREMATC